MTDIGKSGKYAMPLNQVIEGHRFIEIKNHSDNTASIQHQTTGAGKQKHLQSVRFVCF
jgi:hypothetical protein